MNKKFDNSKYNNIMEIKKNIEKLNQIDKTLILQYLDNIKKITKRGNKSATKTNVFLKYM